MSSRKSKKGFQKLENHELAEFTSIGNGGLDSGSEQDLLDMTSVQSGERRSFCGCWCSCVGFSVLTLLVLLVGLYCGYLTYYLWLLNGNTADTHGNLDNRLGELESGLSNYKSAMEERHSSLQSELTTLRITLNDTHQALLRYHEDMGKSLAELVARVDDVDTRLKVVESQPQETLIRQVDLINKDMGVLNSSMRKLNKSLTDINQVKEQIAELGSTTSQYDDQIIKVKTEIASVRQESSAMKESVDAAVDTVADFKGDLSSLDSRLTTSHEQMTQTTDLLSAQVTDVQKRVGVLNETLDGQVTRLWSNVTAVSSSLASLSAEVAVIQEAIAHPASQHPDSTEPLDHTPTGPPPTTQPLAEGDHVTSPELPEDESTGATEDLATTEASEVETTQTSLEGQTTPSPEDQILSLMKELNKTIGAIDFLQTVVDNFNTLDMDNNEKLNLDEFEMLIPKPFIFQLLDNNHDGDLLYDEVLESVDNLQRKSNSLKAQLKAYSQDDGGPTQGPDTGSTTTDELPLPSDPVLQEKLRELYKYIFTHEN